MKKWLDSLTEAVKHGKRYYNGFDGHTRSIHRAETYSTKASAADNAMEGVVVPVNVTVEEVQK